MRIYFRLWPFICSSSLCIPSLFLTLLSIGIAKDMFFPGIAREKIILFEQEWTRTSLDHICWSARSLQCRGCFSRSARAWSSVWFGCLDRAETGLSLDRPGFSWRKWLVFSACRGVAADAPVKEQVSHLATGHARLRSVSSNVQLLAGRCGPKVNLYYWPAHSSREVRPLIEFVSAVRSSSRARAKISRLSNLVPAVLLLDQLPKLKIVELRVSSRPPLPKLLS